jgi:hypothetical protein
VPPLDGATTELSGWPTVLGLRITQEDERKFYMQRDPDRAAPVST